MCIKHLLQALLCILCSCLLLSCQESDLGGLTLSANAEPHYVVSTDVSTLDLSAYRQEKTLEVKANCSWTVECDANWITVIPKSGHIGTMTVLVLVESNTFEDERQASLLFYSQDGRIQQSVSVLQRGRVEHEGNESLSEKNDYTVNGVNFKMIVVPGGTFLMGATSEQHSSYSDEKPVHDVTLSNYCIGETEVTQALWKAVMGNKPSEFSGGDKLPVENVSWDDCQAFIKKLNELTGANFRLPTEAEWEYAARGGNKSRKTQYSGSSNIDDVAWYDANSGSKTHAVKTKQPNELGLYDMSGNVWEWCQDWYGSYSSGTVTNPQGPSSGTYRVHRGGGWSSIAEYCRSANRHSGKPTYRYNCVGLRLAL